MLRVGIGGLAMVVALASGLAAPSQGAQHPLFAGSVPAPADTPLLLNADPSQVEELRVLNIDVPSVLTTLMGPEAEAALDGGATELPALPASVEVYPGIVVPLTPGQVVVMQAPPGPTSMWSATWFGHGTLDGEVVSVSVFVSRAGWGAPLRLLGDVMWGGWRILIGDPDGGEGSYTWMRVRLGPYASEFPPTTTTVPPQRQAVTPRVATPSFTG